MTKPAADDSATGRQALSVARDSYWLRLNAQRAKGVDRVDLLLALADKALTPALAPPIGNKFGAATGGGGLGPQEAVRLAVGLATLLRRRGHLQPPRRGDFCPFGIGQAVTVRPDHRHAADFPGVWIVTGVRWDYQRAIARVDVAIATAAEIMRGAGSTDGWLVDDLVASDEAAEVSDAVAAQIRARLGNLDGNFDDGR